MSGLFLGEGPSAPSLNILTCVYNMLKVSTISRPRLLRADTAYRLHTAISMEHG